MNDYSQKQLNGNEHLMVRLAVACGCLDGLNNMEPGEAHSRKKRMLSDLREILVTKVALPQVTQKNMDLFGFYIQSGEEVIKDIMKDAERPAHILLNLVRYCLLDQPMKETHRSKIDHFFGMWDGAYMYPDMQESGSNIFGQIEAGAQKLLMQQPGALV